MIDYFLALYEESHTDEQWDELEDFFYEHLSDYAERMIGHNIDEGTLLSRYINFLKYSPTETSIVSTHNG